MKKWFVFWMLACGCFWMAYSAEKDREFERAIVKGADACFILRVVDDAGQPVAGAKVNALLGMNFREKANFVDGCTSTNGELRIEGKTTGNEIEFEVSKCGYYSSKSAMCLITRLMDKKVRDGKWQPWGERREIRLRRICNPVQLGRQLKYLRVPVTNEWIGVDLRKVDWVKPHGEGVNSDIVLNVKWDGLPPAQSKLCSFDMRVVGDRNGFYLCKKVLESEYRETHVADISQMYSMTKMNYAYSRDAIMDPTKDFWFDQEAVFRVRSEIDQEGSVIAANYASVRRCVLSPGTKGRGALLELGCAFNPTPNDPNLEDAEVANRIRRRREIEERREKARLKKQNESLFFGGLKNVLGL